MSNRDISEAVGIALMPAPLPEAELSEEEQGLVDRIERLEQKFVAEASGKKRFKIRTLIEELETKLALDALRKYNVALRQRLEEATVRERATLDELEEMRALTAEIKEQWANLLAEMKGDAA